jgi:amyloid beta precursor protein binding protein 1
LSDLFATTDKITLVIYTNPIEPTDLKLIEAYGHEHKVPVFAVHSAGFYSYFQIRLPGSFPIVDTHPDSTATTDLRLLTPWPELSEFARGMTVHIKALSDHDHGHIPYLVLLLYFLEVWKRDHDGRVPGSYSEKVAFRKMLAAAARDGGEENFDEAVAAVLKTISLPALSSAVKEVFQYSHTDPVCN